MLERRRLWRPRRCPQGLGKPLAVGAYDTFK